MDDSRAVRPQSGRQEATGEVEATLPADAWTVAVASIMDRHFYYVRPHFRATRVLERWQSYGITYAPLIDDDGRPLAIIDERELLALCEGSPDPSRARVRDASWSKPPAISHRSTVAEAAQLLASAASGHAVVVDDEGIAVGLLTPHTIQAWLGSRESTSI